MKDSGKYNFILKNNQYLHLDNYSYKKIQNNWKDIENCDNDIEKFFIYQNILNEYFYHDVDSEKFYKQIGLELETIKATSVAAVMLNEDFSKDYIYDFCQNNRNTIANMTFENFKNFYSRDSFHYMEKLHNFEDAFFDRAFCLRLKEDNSLEVEFEFKTIIPANAVSEYFYLSLEDLELFSEDYDVEEDEFCYNVKSSFEYSKEQFNEIKNHSLKVCIKNYTPQNDFSLDSYISCYENQTLDIAKFEFKNHIEKYLEEDELEQTQKEAYGFNRDHKIQKTNYSENTEEIEL